jgi:hypothetical protein
MRRIVIHLHGQSTDTTSLASAIAFSRKLNARLSVVFIRRTRELIPVPGDGIPVVLEREPEAAAGAEAAYRALCEGLSFVTYTEAEVDSVELITLDGLLHDMTVVERLTEREGSKVADSRIPGDIRADSMVYKRPPHRTHTATHSSASNRPRPSKAASLFQLSLQDQDLRPPRRLVVSNIRQISRCLDSS